MEQHFSLWQATTGNCNRKGSIKLLHGCCLSTIMWKRSSKKILQAQHKTNINVICWRKGISPQKFTWKATIIIELKCLKKKSCDQGLCSFIINLHFQVSHSRSYRQWYLKSSDLMIFMKIILLNALRSIKYFSEVSWVMTVNFDH